MISEKRARLTQLKSSLRTTWNAYRSEWRITHEHIACNSCVGDTAEFVCSRSIRRREGLPCLQSGPAEFHLSLLFESPRAQPAALVASLRGIKVRQALRQR